MHFLFASMALAVIPALSDETPNRQPQLAASKNTVALVFGSGKNILFAKSVDRGATFWKPVPIAELQILPLGRHRGPRVAFAGGNTIVVSAIGGTKLATGPHAHGLPSDGDLFAWRSINGGQTWSKSIQINDAPGSAREGLHAMTADEQGNVAAVWLDLRATGTRLFGSVSNDGGMTWSKNFPVYESPDGTICQCCHPSLVALGDGQFQVMFRNVIGANRDMYTLRLKDGQVVAKAQKAGQDSWAINACPMDGGGVALSNGRVVTAWRRDEDVYLAPVGEKEIRLGAGKDVAIAAGSSKVFVVWNAAGAIQASAGGKLETLTNEGAFPSVAALPGTSALAAWEEKGSIAIRRLD